MSGPIAQGTGRFLFIKSDCYIDLNHCHYHVCFFNKSKHCEIYEGMVYMNVEILIYLDVVKRIGMFWVC